MLLPLTIKISSAYSGLGVSALLTLGEGEAHAEAVSAAGWLDTVTPGAAVRNLTLK